MKVKYILRTIMTLILVAFTFLWPIYFLNDNIDNHAPKENQQKQWTGIIELWDFPRLNVNTHSRYGWIKNKIKRFERENPGVYIDLKPISWSKGPVKLEVALNTGNVPDIAPVATDYLYMNENVLEPLDKYFTKEEKDEYKYQSLRAVTNNNVMWGIPFMMTGYAMYINLDVFNQMGVEPPIDGNWTYEEFIEKMQKLTWDSDNDGEVDHYGFTSFVKPNYYNLWGIILSDGAEIFKNNKYVFYGDNAVKGLDKVVNMKNKYNITPEGFGIMDENEAWDMFSNKQNVAAYATGSWAVRVLEKRYSEGKGFNFDIVNYPIGNNKIPVSLGSNISAYGIFKQDDKEKLKMCVKFLKFITQDKYQKQLEDLGVFPVKRDIEDIYINNPKMKKIEESLTYTKNIPKHSKWKDIDRILQSQIRLAIIGDKSTEEAISESRRQIYKILSYE